MKNILLNTMEGDRKLRLTAMLNPIRENRVMPFLVVTTTVTHFYLHLGAWSRSFDSKEKS